ncbi:MAG: outer membrane protein assembly factor BamA [Spirochaetales bacterium]|nr:outer membrane protein assembly factor BamA [Spirochaetales bacterium]
MRKWPAILLALLVLAPAAFAQDEWYIGKPIADFRFTGLQIVNESELAPIVRPYVGQEFTLDVFFEIQDKLYALDYFELIEANAEPGDPERSSVIVQFRVQEKPTVGEILLEGNRRLRRTEILDRVLLKKGDMVTQTQATLDAQAIADLYLEKGYTDAMVTAELLPGEENTVTVRFVVNEGVQTAIRTIAFSGNSFASESTLRRVMKTKQQGLFSTGVFQEARFEEDLKAIVDYYGERGYVDAKIEKVDRAVERDEKEGKNYLNITIYLSEGEQWTYGGMDFEGNQIFTDEELQAQVRQTPGSILNRSKLEADTQRVADLYFENGYIFNLIDRSETRDEKKKEIRYTIHVVERDRAHIESILIKGNDKTKDYVIYRELPFEEGDVFNKKKVVQGLLNLYNLQYFSAVEPETPQGSAEGLMDLVINVEEGSTATINFGVTFSGGDYPISGLLKWEESNFLGRGLTIGVNSELSTLRQYVSLNFEEPWLFGYRLAGGVSFSFEHATVRNVAQDILFPIYNGDEDELAAPDPYEDYDEWQAAVDAGESIPEQYTMDYELWEFALGFTTGYRYLTPLGWLGVRAGLSGGVQQISYDDTLYRPFDPDVRRGHGQWLNVNKLGLTGYWDNRDYFLNPSEGWYLGQGVTFALGFPVGTREFIRTDTTLQGFLPLVDVPVTENWNFKVVLAAYSALSLILPQFGQDAPIAITDDLLYVDGWNIARGWDLDYDKAALWDNRLELRMPISEQLLWWVFFFDAVAAYDEVAGLSTMHVDDFLFGFGGGLRFSIPQFPIRLYIAKRFKSQDGAVLWQDGALFPDSLKLDFVISIGGDTF